MFFFFLSGVYRLVHWRFSLFFFPGCSLPGGKALNDLLQRLKNLENLDEEKSGLASPGS